MKYFLLILLSINYGFAQTLSSSLDKRNIELGELAVLTIRIDNLNTKPVVSSARNELLPFHFEEIKDEIQQNENQYLRTIEFSIFDEGIFSIPALEFKVGDSIHKTIPYEIEVHNPAQASDMINDIMNNQEVALEWLDYWELYKWYILAILIFLASVFLAIVFIKYGRKKAIENKKPTHQTMKALEQLKRKQYIENKEYRNFYVELIDICRNFLTAQYGIPADVLLTDDLIDYMSQYQSISKENETIVKEILLRGDMVKFAKSLPTGEVMQRDWEAMRDFVKCSVKDLEFENLRKNV